MKQGKEIQSIQFGEKSSTHEFNIGTKSCAQRDTQCKGRPDLKLNKGGGILKVRPHSAKLPTYTNELKFK